MSAVRPKRNFGMKTTPSLPSFATADHLMVETYPDRAAMGRAAARKVAAQLKEVLSVQAEARVIFACAPSQDEFLASLVDPAIAGTTINWQRIVAFHMDEYVGLAAEHPQSFRRYLREHLLRHVSIGSFHPIEADARDSDEVCRSYAGLLAERPIDLVCLGIGENGHIAFNDPPVAQFADRTLVKVVELDDACRRQQVNDGCFAKIAAVPTHAITLTIPVFLAARRLSVHVPGPRKAAAVAAALRGPISTLCPASILRTHPRATLYLDSAASGAGQDTLAH